MSHGAPGAATARALQALLLALLAAAAVAALSLHADGWPQGLPAPGRGAAAGSVLLAYAGACIGGWRWRAARRARTAARDAADAFGAASAPLVVFASQTGFAQHLAELTRDSLRAGGLRPALCALGALDGDRLARSELALFVVSTTGEGDPPDAALGFAADTMTATPALAGLRYAVLALGDRGYVRYCAFGHALDEWLRGCGARPLFDVVEVDNGDGGALRRWQHDIGQLAGMDAAATDGADWSPPRYGPWTLAARRELNPGSLGGGAFELRLLPGEGTLPAWTAGDIAEIGPRHAPGDVTDWLRTHGHDGNTAVEHDEATLPFAALLARSRWPGASDAALDTRALAARLQPLPHRDYSIASVPGDGHLRLLVRRMQRPDGQPGLGSGWLCDHLATGGELDLRIRANPGFHPPAHDGVPLILIGNGTGLAGLRAHLSARAAAGTGRAWLLFGERQRTRDAFWADELDAWQRDGTLARVDLAFSRDDGDGRYVQHALRDAGDTVRAWVADGACVLVCGSAAGMAPAVDDTLAAILGHEALDALRREGRYRRDVY